MPIYDFRNKNTDEIVTKSMRISEMEQWLKDNPEYEHFFSNLTLGDPVRLGIRKIDAGFKEVLQKVHSKTPGSELNRMTNI
jgi:hypothetical protein